MAEQAYKNIEGCEPLKEERNDAIVMLRQVCEDWGDNDWADNLHLADIIEKHLWRHLEARAVMAD